MHECTICGCQHLSGDIRDLNAVNAELLAALEKLENTEAELRWTGDHQGRGSARFTHALDNLRIAGDAARSTITKAKGISDEQ